MALQVWLPLNGNLDNQGLSNVTVTNNGATIDDNGKIGKCYKFNPDDSSSGQNYLRLNKNLSDILPTNGKSFSFACWIKITGNLYSNGCGLICANQYNSTGVGLYIKSTKKIHIQMCYNGTEQEWTANNMTALQNNVWYHVTYTYNEIGSQMTVYINGVNVDSTTANNVWVTRNAKILIGVGNQGGWAYTLPGFMNDVRIYDHCLSPKEVHEIAKGLVLHYKLDELCKYNHFLPYGVELYDYIESTGTQWIDTQYNLNTGDTLEFIYMDVFNGSTKVTGSSENKGYGQGFGSNSSANYSGGGRISSGKIAMWVNGINTTTNISSSSSTGKYKETLVISDSNVKIKFEEIGGSVYIDTTLSTSTHNAAILYFFKDSATSFAYPGVKKFFESKILHNNQLVRNFLPCTYFGEPGMWDTVENKFYKNQGTGTFILGTKIILKEYEYLQGDGTAYIDTGLPMNRNTTIDYAVSMNNNTNQQRIIGHEVGNQLTLLMYIGDSSTNIKTFSKLNASGTYTALISYNTNKHYYLLNEFGTHRFYIDGILTGTYSSIPSNDTYYGNCYLFWANGSGNPKAKCKIYYCKIYDNNVLKRYLIPCSYSGTPGMWDMINYQFYPNANSTGTFTLGPENLRFNKIYDCSGYKNHGTITGTLSLNSDTPRYNYSILFNGQGLISTTASGQYILTMSIWSKDKGTIPSNGLMFKDHLGDMALGIQSNILYSGKSGGHGAGSTNISNVNYTVNTWHHWVMVNRDNTYYVYMDGQQVLSGTSGSWSAGSVTNALHIGGRSGSSPWPGSLSDFRAYATVLSVEDILELYNTPTFIDNQGNLLSMEFDSLFNNQEINIGKNGITNAINFVEEGNETQFFKTNTINSTKFLEI